MPYCSNCGEKLEEGDLFCRECGTKQEILKPAEIKAVPKRRTSEKKPVKTEMEVGQVVGGSGNIRYCADGQYRWIYELSMLKNPTIIFTVWKVLALCGLFPAVISAIGARDGFLVFFQVYGIVLGILTVLSIVAYLLLALLYRGKYIVLFEMGEKGIIHKQQDKQFKKAQGIAWLNMMAGISKGKPGMVGQAIMISSQNSMSSDFEHVKKVTCIRNRNTIKLDQPMSHNQIYVENEDWDFVKNYIVSRCTNAKIR